VSTPDAVTPDTPTVRPIRVAGVREPRRASYFYRLNADDQVAAFCVANADDTPTDEFPDGQFVQSRAADGTEVRWAKRVEGDLLVFYPPDPALAFGGIVWAYDRRVQVGRSAPRQLLEKLALDSRVSVAL
jgi:hypothetical protein